MMDSDMQS
jgi:hypothetical protein